MTFVRRVDQTPTWVTGCAMMLLTMLTTGCVQQRHVGLSAPLRLEGLERTRLEIRPDEAAYVAIDRSEASFIVRQRTVQEDGTAFEHIVRVVMLWNPRAGATPMDSTATNASVHWVIRNGDEVGIYAGGGFAVLRGRIGAGTVTVRLTDTSLRLLTATEGFRDPLTAARAIGEFTAEPDRDRYAAMLAETRNDLFTRFGRSDALPRGITSVPGTFDHRTASRHRREGG